MLTMNEMIKFRVSFQTITKYTLHFLDISNINSTAAKAKYRIYIFCSTIKQKSFSIKKRMCILNSKMSLLYNFIIELSNESSNSNIWKFNYAIWGKCNLLSLFNYTYAEHQINCRKYNNV